MKRLMRIRGGAVAGMLFLGLLCAFPTAEVGAIKRERPVEARARPELVVISVRNTKDGKQGFCSGALIAGRVVLTAAHCARGFDAWDLSAPYAKKGAVRAQSRTARVHPAYDPRKPETDLALLILDNDLDIGAKFPTLYSGDLLRLGSKLTVIGRVDNGKLARERLFESADVSIVDDQVNVNVYGGNPPVVEKGDSGGPVYTASRQPELVAVISGYQDVTGELVPTDLYAPLNKRNQEWIAHVLRQVQRERNSRK